VSAMPRSLQRFHVGIKAFVHRGGRLLMLREASGARLWELPGGRIDEGEEELPQADVLRRELGEELGPGFACEIGAPLVTWIRPVDAERREFTFLVGLDCTSPRGAITLSDEHVEMRWVGPDETVRLELAPGYGPALEHFWSRMT